MEIYLCQRTDRGPIAVLNVGAKTFEFLAINLPPEVYGKPLSGWWMVVDETPVAFFRHPVTKELHLLIGADDIVLADGMVLEPQYLDAWKDEFIIWKHGQAIFRLQYLRPQLNSSDRYMIDVENLEYDDFDIFAKAANIWNDPDRRISAISNRWPIR